MLSKFPDHIRVKTKLDVNHSVNIIIFFSPMMVCHLLFEKLIANLIVFANEKSYLYVSLVIISKFFYACKENNSHALVNHSHSKKQ